MGSDYEEDSEYSEDDEVPEFLDNLDEVVLSSDKDESEESEVEENIEEEIATTSASSTGDSVSSLSKRNDRPISDEIVVTDSVSFSFATVQKRKEYLWSIADFVTTVSILGVVYNDVCKGAVFEEPVTVDSSMPAAEYFKKYINGEITTEMSYVMHCYLKGVLPYTKMLPNGKMISVNDLLHKEVAIKKMYNINNSSRFFPASIREKFGHMFL